MLNWKCRSAVIVLCISTYIPGSCYALDPPPITSVEEFFTIGSVPSVPDDWRLIVDGAVESPLSLTLDELMLRPATTQMSTLECYFPVGPLLLIGNADWTGIPLDDIIDEARPLSEAVSITFVALDRYSLGPYDLNDIRQRSDFLLAYGINGQLLPSEQGYPLKLVLPGIAGFQNVRWLERIEIKTLEPTLSLVHYPIHARIFEPSAREDVTLGRYTIRGMAYAGEGKEVTEVEVSTDGGLTWHTATLINYFVPNVWKFWELKLTFPI